MSSIPPPPPDDTLHLTPPKLPSQSRSILSRVATILTVAFVVNLGLCGASAVVGTIFQAGAWMGTVLGTMSGIGMVFLVGLLVVGLIGLIKSLIPKRT